MYSDVAAEFNQSGASRAILVAVGTPIPRRPPRRSVQAVLPHTALTLDSGGKKIIAAHRAIRGTRELPHCVGNVSDRTMFSLVHALPSPTSAEGYPSLFGWFIGSMAWSDSSEACMPALRLWAFSGRPRSGLQRGAPEVSRFSCMLFLGVRGFFDYAGPAGRSRLTRPTVLPSPLRQKVGILINGFSKLNRPAHRYLYLRFERHLTMPPARLEARMDSLFSFPVGSG